MYKQVNIDRLAEEGRIRINPDESYYDLNGNRVEGRPEYFQTETIPVDNNWTDIKGYGYSNDYPTENHEELLERVLLTASVEGDIVLDAFAGSGTTMAVAEKLKRRWIGIDCGKLSMYTIVKRMLNLRTAIGNASGRRLPHKPFTLYNAGLYDFSQLKELPWADWRFFALNLFQCTDEPHSLRGIEMDGYRNGYDVLVFNHMVEGGVVLDYGFIDNLHSIIGSRAGSRVFVIAPAASVTFFEDYIDQANTRYFILRIPYSIINELHSREFEAIIQPVDERHINETVEAVGFDFIRAPKIECEYLLRPREGEMLSDAIVKINTFVSQAMVRGGNTKGNLETLSMVLVDYNYPFDSTRTGRESAPPFTLDTAFYAKEIQAANWEFRLSPTAIRTSVMLIYVDIYGNEFTEIKHSEDFVPTEAQPDPLRESETANA